MKNIKVMLPVRRTFRPTMTRFFNDDFNDLFNWPSRTLTNGFKTTPAVNIQELDEEFVVEVAAPGFKKDDFQIEVENDVLTIKSEISEDTESKEDNYTRKEFIYSSFSRSFNLNKEMIDDAKIKASYEEGILKIKLPKREEAKVQPARMIKVG